MSRVIYPTAFPSKFEMIPLE